MVLKSKGFTIIEVLVSLALIVVITGIIMINFSFTKNNQELGLVAEMVATKIRDLEIKTVTGSKFNPGQMVIPAKYYFIILEDGSYQIYADDVLLEQSDFPGFAITPVECQLEFDLATRLITVNEGCPSSPLVRIVVSNTDNRSRIINLNTETGQLIY